MIVDLHWTSTPEERYDTDMNSRASRLVPEYGRLVSSEGGSGGGQADNNLIVDVPHADAALALAKTVATEVGHVVRVHHFRQRLFIGEVSP